jgi:tetratricopeptide (TPR) repeat protein
MLFQPSKQSSPAGLRRFSAAMIRLFVFLLIASRPLFAGPEITLRPVAWSEQEAELRGLRSVLKGDSENISLAVHVAWRLVEKARRDGTPQPLSHAISALAPWWQEAAPHPEVLLLRATIRQSLHEFAPALKDLDSLVKACPRHAQAWLTRATVQLVSGDLEASVTSCHTLKELASPLIYSATLTAAESLRSDTPAARVLEQLLSSKPAESPAIQSWACSILADHHARWDRRQRADEWFREAIDLTPDDRSLLAARADFLLVENLPGEVKRLLESRTSDDLLLLRLALAAKAQHDPATVYTNLLRDHAATARELEVALHLREEAMLHLYLLNDPVTALPLAVRNWQAQREATDARLLLAAAAAAGQSDAAKPVLEWMAQQHVTVPDLTKAAAMCKSSIAASK